MCRNRAATRINLLTCWERRQDKNTAICGSLQSPESPSNLSRCLHTAEVAGSIGHRLLLKILQRVRKQLPLAFAPGALYCNRTATRSTAARPQGHEPRYLAWWDARASRCQGLWRWWHAPASRKPCRSLDLNNCTATVLGRPPHPRRRLGPPRRPPRPLNRVSRATRSVGKMRAGRGAAVRIARRGGVRRGRRGDNARRPA